MQHTKTYRAVRALTRFTLMFTIMTALVFAASLISNAIDALV